MIGRRLVRLLAVAAGAVASVDGVLYSKDLTVVYAVPGAKTSVSLPSGLKEIGNQAFQGCALNAVTIPGGETPSSQKVEYGRFVIDGDEWCPHLVYDQNKAVDFAVDAYGADGWRVTLHFPRGSGYVENAKVGEAVNNNCFLGDKCEVTGEGDVFRFMFRWWCKVSDAATIYHYGWVTLGTDDGKLTILGSGVCEVENLAVVGDCEETQDHIEWRTPTAVSDEGGMGKQRTSGEGDTQSAKVDLVLPDGTVETFLSTDAAQEWVRTVVTAKPWYEATETETGYVLTLNGKAAPVIGRVDFGGADGTTVSVWPENVKPNLTYGLGRSDSPSESFVVEDGAWVRADEDGVLHEALTAPKIGPHGFYRVIVK